MITHIVATVILALTYGAFWHNQPARGGNEAKGDPAFQLGRLLKRLSKRLLLIPHGSIPPEKKESVFLAGKGVKLERQPEFFRQVLRAFGARKQRHRTIVGLTAIQPSKPADLFESRPNLDGLAAERTT